MLAGEGVYWVVPEELEVKAESSVGQVGAVAEATLHCMVGSMQANWQPLRPRRSHHWPPRDPWPLHWPAAPQ